MFLCGCGYALACRKPILGGAGQDALNLDRPAPDGPFFR